LWYLRCCWRRGARGGERNGAANLSVDISRRDGQYDSLAARIAPGTDAWGFPTGEEASNYGSFLDAVQNPNLSIFQTLLSRAW